MGHDVSMYEHRVIVAGGRDFKDKDLLFNKLDTLFSNIEDKSKIVILCGEALGADTLGKEWAIVRGIAWWGFPAEWENLEAVPCKIKTNKYGKKYNALAGINRNHEMGDLANKLVAFWNGKSTGTKDMISYSRKLGHSVRIVKY